MTMLKPKKTKIEEMVVDTYQKIEDTVVGPYQKIEDAVVGTYLKVEDKFVENFLDVEEEIIEIPEEGDRETWILQAGIPRHIGKCQETEGSEDLSRYFHHPIILYPAT